MKNKYDCNAHAKTKLRYHLIFSTKYRRKCLNDIKDSILKIFREIESNSELKILKMNLEEDHIHFLITFPPKWSISQIVRRLKQQSAFKLWQVHGSYLKKFYWNKKHLWTNGYFISTIGNVSEDKIFNYIDNQ